jgi:hypothetical protein
MSCAHTGHIPTHSTAQLDIQSSYYALSAHERLRGTDEDKEEL